MKIIHTSKCLEYSPLMSPEVPGRVEYSANLLQNKGYEFIEPVEAEEKDLLLAHTPNLIKNVLNDLDLDTESQADKNIYNYAALAAGAAIKAADRIREIFIFSSLLQMGG